MSAAAKKRVPDAEGRDEGRKRLTIRIPQELFARIVQHRIKDDRDLNSQITHFLRWACNVRDLGLVAPNANTDAATIAYQAATSAALRAATIVVSGDQGVTGE